MSDFIFDMGGVLISFNTKLIIQKISEESGISIVEIRKRYNYEIIYKVETGQIKGIDFFNQYVKPMVPGWSYDDWISAWMENFTINPPGKELFFELKTKGGQVYILSNLAEYNKEALERKYPEFFSSSNGNFFSYDLGLHKPDVRIYQKVCDCIGSRPEECVFIDDMVENIEGARIAGMQGIHFSNDNISSIREKLFALI